MGLSGNAFVSPSNPPLPGSSVTVSTDLRFKGLIAVDRVNGSVQITNAYPAGTYEVVVTERTGGNAAERRFNLNIVRGPTCNGPTGFGLVQTNSVPTAGSGSTFSRIALGDFNRDGIVDMISTNIDVDTVSVRLGNGEGGFTAPAVPEVNVGRAPQGIKVGDFNADGKHDFAVANVGGFNISIRLGDGLGGFTSPTVSEVSLTGLRPNEIEVGDFNRDGYADLASTLGETSSGGVSIRFGDGQGGFTVPPVPTVPTGPAPQSLAIGDVNGDGYFDLAVTNAGSLGPFDVVVHLGDGVGGFAATPVFRFQVGVRPGVVFMEDFDSDGDQDLFFANSTTGELFFGIGDGLGAFSFPAFPPIAVGQFRTDHVASGDLDRDGRTDLILGLRSGFVGAVWAVRGNGDGSFQTTPAASFDTPAGVSRVAMADLNNDGVQDIVSTRDEPSIQVALGSCSVLPVSVSGRVLTPGGNGIRNVVVVLTDSQGFRRLATTSSFGAYSFANVPVGSYVVSAVSKRYRFASIQLQLNADAVDVFLRGLE